METIKVERPKTIDKAKASSEDTPKYPKPNTIIPSLTPHPAIEIGSAIKKITKGIINKRFIHVTVKPIPIANK